MCVRASMASAGRAFNLSGQPDGEQRPAVSSRGARAERLGSSSRRTAFKGRLGVILNRPVETREFTHSCGGASYKAIDNQHGNVSTRAQSLLAVRTRGSRSFAP